MSTDEAFCLKWNDFQESISSSLGPLLTCSELQDVTLQCGPHTSDSLQCHRLVLAVCSDWFRNIFKSLTASGTRHPVIVLWDTAAKDMSLLLDFMYHGEVNVKQENLNSFLALAEKLSVRGLTQSQSQTQSQPQSQKRLTISQSQAEKKKVKPSVRSEQDIEEVAVVKQEQPREAEYEVGGDGGELVQFEGYDVDYYEADQTGGMEFDSQEAANIVNSKGPSVVSLSQLPTIGGGVCPICSKSIVSNLKRHVEDLHCPGEFPCPHCAKMYSSRNKLASHVSQTCREKKKMQSLKLSQ